MRDCAEGRIHSSSLMGTTPICSSIEGGVLPYTQRETSWHFPLPFSSHNLKAYVGTRLNPWTVLPNSKFRPFGNVPFKKWNVMQVAHKEAILPISGALCHHSGGWRDPADSQEAAALLLLTWNPICHWRVKDHQKNGTKGKRDWDWGNKYDLWHREVLVTFKKEPEYL